MTNTIRLGRFRNGGIILLDIRETLGMAFKRLRSGFSAMKLCLRLQTCCKVP